MNFAHQFDSQSKYLFRKKIGSGGTAEVFLYSRQTEGLPAQDIALKILKVQREDQILELLNEGRRLGALKHPNILTTFGYEKIDSQKFGLVLEYFPGENLKAIIPRLSKESRHSAAEYIIKTICEALSLAHSQGIIHGDLSGRNVLVSGQGQLKLSDFGLACLISAAREKMGGPIEPSADNFRVKGSADYMSPELWKGSPPSVSSDIFALGVLALEILEGANPLGQASSCSPSNLILGFERVQNFIKSEKWKEYEKWQIFFEECFASIPEKRPSAIDLSRLIPISEFGSLEIQREIAGIVKDVTLFEKTKTETHVFSKVMPKIWNIKKIRSTGILALILFAFSIMTSEAIGLDHAISGRLRPCLMTLTSLPWGEVFIDGISRGYTPFINLPITPGFHILLWKDIRGHTVKKTLMAFENGTMAYKISAEKGRFISAPLPTFRKKL
jgi:serine/threonine protein kinase